MPTISLGMIVKDEQDTLENCLNSVKDIVDEMVIVDTGSTDKTIEIAKKFNAVIIPTKWEDDFSSARNLSLQNATKEWILVLDADETISKEDLPRLKKLTESKGFEGFMLIQRSYIDNTNSPKWVSSKNDNYNESKPYAGWIYSGITRLFRNRKEIRFEYPVHETVKESIKRINGRIGITNIPIHHYGKVRDPAFIDKKSSMYLEIGKKKLKENQNPKFYYELGIQAQVIGRFEDATNLFKKAIELNPQLTGAYINLGSLYCRLNKYDDALDILKKAEKITPHNSELHNNIGVALEKLNQNEKAFEEYKKAIAINPDNIEALLNASKLLFTAGKLENVKKLLERVLLINPKEIHAHNILGVIYSLQGDLNDAVECFKKVLNIEPNNKDAMMNLGYTYITLGRNEEAKEIFKKLISMGYEVEKLNNTINAIK